MRQTYVAIDAGPAENLGMIVRTALGQGHRIAFVGNDEVGVRDMFEPLPDVLVVGGPASFRAEAEVTLIERAWKLKVPTVVIADTHYSWARPPAEGRVQGVALVVASPMEIGEAEAFGYNPVTYLGGPPRWQEYGQIKAAAPMASGLITLMVVGIKDAMLTDRMLEAVVAGADANFDPGKWNLVFKPHGNEDAATQDSVRRSRILEGVRIIGRGERTTNLLPVVDMTIVSGGATDAIAGAYLRVPVIFYEDDDVRTRNRKQVGRPTWYPAEAGACLKAGVSSADDPTIAPALPMAEAIKQLTSEEGAAALKRRQEEVYPALPAGEAVEAKILQFIAEFTSKK